MLISKKVLKHVLSVLNLSQRRRHITKSHLFAYMASGGQITAANTVIDDRPDGMSIVHKTVLKRSFYRKIEQVETCKIYFMPLIRRGKDDVKVRLNEADSAGHTTSLRLLQISVHDHFHMLGETEIIFGQLKRLAHKSIDFTVSAGIPSLA